MELLESFVTMNTRLTYSIAPFRDALINSLRQRGYIIDSEQPWKDALPEALTWYHVLKHEVDTRVEQLLSDQEKASKQWLPDSRSNDDTATECHPQLANRILRARCESCFGRSEWGGNADTYIVV
jgi:hypothetical protein